MNKFLKDLITDVAGADYDIAKALWLLGVLSFIVYGGWHIYSNHTFNPMDYGTGLGAALAGGGFGVSQRSKEQTTKE